MNLESANPLFTQGMGSEAAEGDGVRTLKTWVTPKVITSTLAAEDTASSGASNVDSGGHS
jgi:hypothetical protein